MSTPFASLDEALGWLDGHIDYERVAPTRRLLPTLDGVAEALRFLGDPHDTSPVIHITGTNGKGSTTAMITALLVELGLRVGSYTSPNLHRVNERIALNGEPIDDGVLLDALARLFAIETELSEPLTRFELLTVAAVMFFADEADDVAVIEVGLGGTWDSTNVVHGQVSVITNVSLDHTQVLGNTVGEIASDKAGIIKSGGIAILGIVGDDIASIVEDRCEEVGASSLWRAGETFSCEENRLAFGGRLVDLHVPGAVIPDVLVPLHGAHQGDNAAVALAAVTAFLGRPPSSDVVTEGFAHVVIAGRLEVLGHKPLVIVDGAHNPAGAGVLGAALREGFSVDGVSVVVIGMLEGREAVDLFAPLYDAGITHAVCVEPETPRAMAASFVAEAAREVGMHAEIAPSIARGVERGLELAGSDGMVLATGSLYVVGDARENLRTLIAKR